MQEEQLLGPRAHNPKCWGRVRAAGSAEVREVRGPVPASQRDLELRLQPPAVLQHPLPRPPVSGRAARRAQGHLPQVHAKADLERRTMFKTGAKSSGEEDIS